MTADDAVGRPCAQPARVRPMLATLDETPFSRAGWFFERKLDGERCLAFRCGDRVRLRSRTDRSLAGTYPELADALLAQPVDDFVVDGEIVAFAGRSTSFARLQERMQIRDPHVARRSPVKVFYYLFDLLYLMGHDVTGLPLSQRKALLRRALDFGGPLRYTPHRVGAGEALYARACERGWEGVVAKRAASSYEQRRSRDWLKWKCLQVGEFFVGGFTRPEGTRAGFGALLLGSPARAESDGVSVSAATAQEEGSAARPAPLVFVGRVGTGFDERTRDRLGAALAPLQVPEPPFAADADVAQAGGAAAVRWVRPEVVVRVGYSEWTPRGRLRHPRYLGPAVGSPSTRE